MCGRTTAEELNNKQKGDAENPQGQTGRFRCRDFGMLWDLK